MLSFYREIHVGPKQVESKVVHSFAAPIPSFSSLHSLSSSSLPISKEEEEKLSKEEKGEDEHLMPVFGGLVFLSARPHLYKDITEKQSYKLFSELAKNHKMHTMPTLLPGDLKGLKGLRLSGLKIQLREFAEIAEKKLNNCKGEKYLPLFFSLFKFFFSKKAYSELYPENKLIFVGDNGQGDVVAGQRMLKLGMVSNVFIHLIQPIEKSWGYKENKEEWKGAGIIFFKTYVGAAVEAYERKLVHLNGMRRIVLETLSEFKELVLHCKFSSYQIEQSYFEQLLEDIEKANKHLSPEKKIFTTNLAF